MQNEKEGKILQMGERIFGIKEGTLQERVDKTIAAVEHFFNKIGIRTRLSEYGVDKAGIERIVQRMQARGWSLGENENIDYTVIERILKIRL